jgi:hypothetical protein
MAGPIGAVVAANYARSAAQLSAYSTPSPGQAAGVAKMVTQSYGFRLGPLGIEYSRKEVEFSSPTGDAAANAGGVSGQDDLTARSAAAHSMRLIQDQMAASEAGEEPGEQGVSILPRGLAAYAQSALGKDKGRRGSVQAVV